MVKILDNETTQEIGSIAVMYHPSLTSAYVSIWQWDRVHGNQFVMVELHQIKELIETLRRFQNVHLQLQDIASKERIVKSYVPPS